MNVQELIAKVLKSGEACRLETYRRTAATPACVYEWDASKRELEAALAETEQGQPTPSTTSARRNFTCPHDEQQCDYPKCITGKPNLDLDSECVKRSQATAPANFTRDCPDCEEEIAVPASAKTGEFDARLKVKQIFKEYWTKWALSTSLDEPTREDCFIDGYAAGRAANGTQPERHEFMEGFHIAGLCKFCGHPKVSTRHLAAPSVAPTQVLSEEQVTKGGSILALATVTYDQPKEFPSMVKIFVYGVGMGIVDANALRSHTAAGGKGT